MLHLLALRMQRAKGLLRAPDDVTVSALAGRVGYVSEVAFAAAFKQEVGVPPGSYRRSQQH
jgi:AraC-like DNA-binding protein